MPNKGRYWTPQEEAELLAAWQDHRIGTSKAEFSMKYSQACGFSVNAITGKLVALLRLRAVQESTYPIYDEPLQTEGDALVLSDIEFPFHHADFVNRCLDLAKKWKIPHLILDGDTLHFDTISSFEPNWERKKKDGISEGVEGKLMDFAKTLSSRKQGEFMEIISSIGEQEERDGVSSELEVARKALKRIDNQFSSVDFVIGNHEGRLLRALQTTIAPDELLRLLGKQDNPKWRIAPYYFSVLISGSEKFQAEHPKNCRKHSAAGLADKYECHIIMGHNHHVDFQFSTSGRYYAIEIGCCVDETRLPYVAQRHNTGAKHSLGACIVRDGIPWLLHERVDWKRLAKT